MRTQRIQPVFELAATLLLAMGFVLAGSGWSFVLSSLNTERPSWSVCGQAMCSCVMPTAEEPACPLCASGLMDPDERDSETPVRRVPKNDDSVQALGGAGTNIAIAFFVGTMIGQSGSLSVVGMERSSVVAENDCVPRSRGLKLPTPPPRA